jgi:NADPH:quinone reductase-like Zn-dependent oxidoreductase
MKAIVYTRYGSPDVLHLEEVAKPIPKDDEVLVRVLAASLNAADWHFMRGKPFVMRLMGFGLLRPKRTTLGLDFAGRVESVGRNAQRFHPGDAVFGNHFGGFAEYVVAGENSLALKPEHTSFDGAAAVPVAAITALQGLRNKGGIHPGARVLIVGASGGVGTFAVQIAKSFGALVTAVCSARNVEKVRALGADRVIDYTHEDFTHDRVQYDLILVVNGYHPLSVYKHALLPNGRCVLIGGDSLAQLLGGRLAWPVLRGGSSKKLASTMGKVTREDLAVLSELMESGKVVPVVERRYPLRDVPDAMRYLETGHVQGKLVVSLDPASGV